MQTRYHAYMYAAWCGFLTSLCVGGVNNYFNKPCKLILLLHTWEMDEDEIEEDVAYEEVLEGEEGDGDDLQDYST